MMRRLLPWAQLVRLPNAFTALADIGMAAAVAGYAFERPAVFALLLVASAMLYLAGMAWNDYFDRADDARTRPFRPIPSGRISAKAARFLGSLLLVGGVLAAFLASEVNRADPHTYSFQIALGLAALILLYDGWLKHTPLGPVAMGGCRALNVLLGLSGNNFANTSPELAAHAAGTIGIYIVGVTWFARTEEGTSNPRHLRYATLVIVSALVLALTLPLHLPAGTAPVYAPYLVVAFGMYLAGPLCAAIRRPEPKEVQAAVKRCILGLILLDAILAVAFVGPLGFALVLLLLPARWLGRWVYST